MNQHVIDYLNNKKEWEVFLAKLNEFSISEAELEKLLANASTYFGNLNTGQADEGCNS